MKIKIRGGTAESGNLCETCQHFKSCTFQNGNKYCVCTNYGFTQGIRLPLKGDVASCDGYTPKGHVSLHQLKEMAWVIENKGRQIGFSRPGKLDERTQEEIDNLEVSEE